MAIIEKKKFDEDEITIKIEAAKDKANKASKQFKASLENISSINQKHIAKLEKQNENSSDD